MFTIFWPCSSSPVWKKTSVPIFLFHLVITSAAIFSGLEKLIKQKSILPGDDVLLPITGFGLKDPPKDLFN